MNKNIETHNTIERPYTIRDYNGNFKITRRDKLMIGIIIFGMISIVLFDIYILTKGIVFHIAED